MDKVPSFGHYMVRHGGVSANEPIESRGDEDECWAEFLMYRCFVAEFPTPDTELDCGEN